MVQAITARQLQRKFSAAGVGAGAGARAGGKVARYCHRGYMCTIAVGEVGMVRDEDGLFGGDHSGATASGGGIGEYECRSRDGNGRF